MSQSIKHLIWECLLCIQFIRSTEFYLGKLYGAACHIWEEWK